MRTLRWTLATVLAAAALALLAPLAFADGTTIQGTHFKISTSDAGTVELDLGELAMGESRHFTTDEGKPVEITRTEAGYELAVDGEKLDVVLDGDEPGSLRLESAGDEDGERHVVRIRKHHGGHDGEAGMVVTAGDGHGEHEVVRIKRGHGGHDGDVRVKVLDADADAHVVVVRKKAHHGEAGAAGAEPRRIEIRIEKKVKKEVEQEDDGR